MVKSDTIKPFPIAFTAQYVGYDTQKQEWNFITENFAPQLCLSLRPDSDIFFQKLYPLFFFGRESERNVCRTPADNIGYNKGDCKYPRYDPKRSAQLAIDNRYPKMIASNIRNVLSAAPIFFLIASPPFPSSLSTSNCIFNHPKKQETVIQIYIHHYISRSGTKSLYISAFFNPRLMKLYIMKVFIYYRKKQSMLRRDLGRL
jgi:hypothetical protein